jgi:hypothetical protein
MLLAAGLNYDAAAAAANACVIPCCPSHTSCAFGFVECVPASRGWRAYPLFFVGIARIGSGVDFSRRIVDLTRRHQ